MKLYVLPPLIARLELPVAKYTNILRWYEDLAALPAWQTTMASVTEFMKTMEVSR